MNQTKNCIIFAAQNWLNGVHYFIHITTVRHWWNIFIFWVCRFLDFSPFWINIWVFVFFAKWTLIRVRPTEACVCVDFDYFPLGFGLKFSVANLAFISFTLTTQMFAVELFSLSFTKKSKLSQRSTHFYSFLEDFRWSETTAKRILTNTVNHVWIPSREVCVFVVT